NLKSISFQGGYSDLEAAEILINVDHEEPSWWVWVTEDMIPGKVEDMSGIDNESYVLVSGWVLGEVGEMAVVQWRKREKGGVCVL
ncbi:unnamed protein product, partial [Prunus brigantina]